MVLQIIFGFFGFLIYALFAFFTAGIMAGILKRNQASKDGLWYALVLLSGIFFPLIWVGGILKKIFYLGYEEVIKQAEKEKEPDDSSN
ncbi:MAG: hypothetical protein Q8N55_00755 [bacterium]|nr:hypothetical protein [bacterium]